MARKPQPRRTPPKDVKAAADRAEKRARGEKPETAKAEIDPAIILADEIKAKVGRPSKYKPEYARVAQALCRLGATDAQLAEEFEVDVSTIWRWSCKHVEFHNALRVAKDLYDDTIERKLAQRAAGYTVEVEKVFCFQGEIIRAVTKEYIPPDVGAAKFWLMNRRPSDWREATQRVEHGSPGDFDGMSNDELEAYIEAEAKALSETKSAVKRSTAKH